jgi:hypothetical protein
MKRARLTLICLLLLLPASPPSWAEPAVPGPRWVEPNWTQQAALQAAGEVDLVTELGPLFERARAGRDADLRRQLEAVTANEKWPLPARERLLHAFALGLGDLPPGAAGPESLAYLLDYRPRTLVPHEDHASAGVPLFNVPAAAAGSVKPVAATNRPRRVARVPGARRGSLVGRLLRSRPGRSPGFHGRPGAGLG